MNTLRVPTRSAPQSAKLGPRERATIAGGQERARREKATLNNQTKLRGRKPHAPADRNQTIGVPTSRRKQPCITSRSHGGESGVERAAEARENTCNNSTMCGRSTADRGTIGSRDRQPHETSKNDNTNRKRQRFHYATLNAGERVTNARRVPSAYTQERRQPSRARTKKTKSLAVAEARTGANKTPRERRPNSDDAEITPQSGEKLHAARRETERTKFAFWPSY